MDSVLLRNLIEAVSANRELVENDVLSAGVFGSTWQIALSSFLCILVGALATSAGVGGGGLFVPLYAYVLGTGVKYAVPVSKATIFGGSIGKYLGTALAKHPEANRPIVNYNLATMMQSWELLGTIFGVVFNILFPELVIVILLVLVLGFSAYKTLTKGMKKFKEESENLRQMPKNQSSVTLNDDASSEGSDTPPNGAMEETKEDIENTSLNIQQAPSSQAKEDSAELANEKELEAKPFPVWNLAVLGLMTLFIIFYSLVKKGVIGNLQGCSAGYWSFYFIPVPFFCLVGVFVVYMLQKEYKRKSQIGYKYLKGDLEWDSATLKKMPLVGFAAGVCASLVGIGGGMITGPLFLALEMIPQVSSATSAFMIIFTGMSSVVQYLTIGNLPWDFALWFIAMGFIGAQLGHHVFSKILKKTGRPSIICFLLGGIIAVSVLIMFISGIVSVASSPADELFEFSTKGVC